MTTADTIILHLSDIHFRRHGPSGELLDPDLDLRNELEADAAAVQTRLGPVAAILVNGDIAFSGQREEYARAKEWLDALCARLRCPPERVFTTPGNHDVDRSAIRSSKLLQLCHAELRTREVDALDFGLREYFDDSAARTALFLPITAYNEFAARYGCAIDADTPYWEYDGLILNDGSTLVIRGVTSTLVSDEYDDDASYKLVLGSFQATLPRQDGVEYLVLCHHPPQWLRDQDDIEDVLNARVRIQLYGHKHKQKVESVDQRALRVTAGAFQPDRRELNWQPRYNYLNIRVDGGPGDRVLSVDVYPRVWNKEAHRFGADYDLEGSDKRHFNFALPDWEAPHRTPVVVPDESLMQVPPAHDGSEAGEEAFAPREEARMDVDRRLTYRFLNLPYQRRLAVAQQLGLVQDDDQFLSDTNRYRAVFRRARESGRLGELWTAVEQNYDDGQGDPNPFMGR